MITMKQYKTPWILSDENIRFILNKTQKSNEDVIKLIETQKLSTGHAKVLVGLDNASFIAHKIVEKKLSVRQAETFVQLFKKRRNCWDSKYRHTRPYSSYPRLWRHEWYYLFD